MNTLTKFPLVQYAGMDYDNALADFRNMVKENPKLSANIGNFYDSDAGMLLAQFNAYLADNLSTRIDTIANESYISTAYQDKNKLRLLKLINYTPAYAKAASVLVKVDLANTVSSDIIFTPIKSTTDSILTRSANILKVLGTNGYGNPITFEAITVDSLGRPEYFTGFKLKNDGSASYSTEGTSGNPLSLLQGITKQATFISYENNSVFFDLPDTNILHNSIRVFSIIDSIPYEYLYVKNFIQPDAINTSLPIPYTTSLNENGNTRISFGSEHILTNETRRFSPGTTIYVFYRIGDGSLGNIPVKYLNKNITLPLYNGGTVSVSIYNETAGEGGADAETASEAAINGPMSIRTVEKAVTPEDYDIILNNYGNILKVKTYSSVNVPSAFKTNYGRYLNPQEVISFIVLNKDHYNVPSSEYNHFPWMEMKLENRFNELYNFSNATVNSIASTATINSKLITTSASGSPTLFTNFITIDPIAEIASSLYLSDGITANTNLIIKLTKEERNEKYFSEMPFTLVYDTVDSISKAAYLNSSNTSVELSTNAKYLSSKYLEKPLTNNSSVATDVFSYGTIGLVLDEKGLITIDLKAGAPVEALATGKLFRYLSHTAITIPSEYVWTGTYLDAKYLNGIVETMNSQVAAMCDNGEDYSPLRSVQYIGAGKDSPYSVINGFVSALGVFVEGCYPIPVEDTFSKTMSCDINGSSYKFTFSDTIFNDACLTLLSPAERLLATPTNIIGISAMMNYNLTIGVYKFDTGADDWEVAPTILIDDIGFSFELVKRFMTDSSFSYVSMIDMIFFSKTVDGMNPAILPETTPSYIDIDYTLRTGIDASLIHSLASLAESYTITEILPEVIKAANYSSCVSVVEREILSGGNTIWVQYLNIASPLVGKSSSIFFVKTSISGEVDFMNYFYNVQYTTDDGESTEYSITSNKAIGIKKATLLSSNQISSIVNGVELESPYTSGTIIYENNSINTSIDFSENLYYSYKLNNNNTLELGSVYDNYYNTGNSGIDATLKSKVYGLLGSSYKLDTDEVTEILDIDRSNYIVKLSNVSQNKPSIYAINNSNEALNAIPNDVISITTDEIGEIVVTSDCHYFCFSVDGSDPSGDGSKYFKIDVADCLSSITFFEKIKAFIESRGSIADEDREYYKLVNDIIKYDYDTRKVLRFGNIDKTENGKITFYAYEDLGLVSDEDNALLYRSIFGTNVGTNKAFYDLYESDIPEANKYHVRSDPIGVYSFYPTLTVPITFKYKKIVDNIPRYGDYYIDSVKNPVSGEYVYSIVKTSNSTFQDTQFYLNFVNDKTKATKVLGDGSVIDYVTEEEEIENYISRYTISGVSNNFLIPLFKTFDIKATVFYNSAYSESEIRSLVTSNVKSAYYVDNRTIGSSISKSSIYSIISSVKGVIGVNVIYFGLNYGTTANQEYEITANFDEILVLHEDIYDSNRVMIKGLMISYEKGV